MGVSFLNERRARKRARRRGENNTDQRSRRLLADGALGFGACDRAAAIRTRRGLAKSRRNRSHSLSESCSRFAASSPPPRSKVEQRAGPAAGIILRQRMAPLDARIQAGAIRL
jgi:hypothetical protein